MTNPALDFETWPIERCIEYARNPRKNDHAVDRVAAAIKEFGFRVPIVAKSDGLVVDGHLRLKAAKKLGMTEVPVVLADDMTDAQIKAFRLSVNKVAELADWDTELLAIELGELAELDFDLDLIGFDETELAGFLEKNEGLTDPDDTPEVQERAITVPGDTWLLGKHRLRCGDSTNADDVAALMSGQNADLCFTSPPYGQQRDYGAAKEKVSEWDELMSGVFSILPVKAGAQVLVNLGLIHRDNEWLPYWSGWLDAMRDMGWRRFAWYVWDQGPGLPGDWNGRLAPSHEFIFHFNKDSRRANKSVESKMAGTVSNGGLRARDGSIGGRSKGAGAIQKSKVHDSVFRVMRHKGKVQGGSHPAVFPVALVEEVLAAYAKAGDILYEPFGGSGTALIASEKFGAHACVMDMDQQYVDVAVRRWQLFTGQQATLEGDGRTFDEIEAERCRPAA